MGLLTGQVIAGAMGVMPLARLDSRQRQYACRLGRATLAGPQSGTIPLLGSSASRAIALPGVVILQYSRQSTHVFLRSCAMPNEHRRSESTFIEGEGFVVPDPKRVFRFCRMFPKLPKSQHDEAGLKALGKTMQDTVLSTKVDTDIPSGYTYLMQFVDHDLIFDWTMALPSNSPQPTEDEIDQGRSPTMNLDSVYGGGPTYYPALYENDGIRLRLGETTQRYRFGVRRVFRNDLPRHPATHPHTPKQAIIGNSLNDQSLPLAQTHAAFLKFHNKVVEYLQAKTFEEARKTVVQHYQSIVLYDLLPKLVDTTVYDNVLHNGRKFFLPEGKRPAMPVEFAFAAFRFGHSMVRDRYEWNRVFNSEKRSGWEPRLYVLFELTKGSGDLGGYDTLPSDWTVDWRRFYDFSQRGKGRQPRLNTARSIDTKFTRPLQQLPEFAHTAAEQSLAVRDLLRGQEVRLPTGQEVARKMADTSRAVPGAPLLQEQVIPALELGQQAYPIQEKAFDRQTPLLYYVLKEAEVQNQGQRLGKVGSYIVVETIHALIESSSDSILQGWQSNLPSQDPQRFTMLDLLDFLGDTDINPLGDQ